MRHKNSPKRMEAWLAQRDRDGLTWAELSRISGLTVWQLRYWLKRRSRTAAPSRPRQRQFLPVKVLDPQPGASLELIMPSGLRLRIPPDFDQDHLRRLLQALEIPC